MVKKIIATGLCIAFIGMAVPLTAARATNVSAPSGNVDVLHSQLASLKNQISNFINNFKNFQLKSNNGAGNGKENAQGNKKNFPATVAGTVASLPNGTSFNLQSTGANATTTVTVIYNATTTVMMDGKAAAIGDIAVGQKAIARGDKDAAGNVTAKNISIINAGNGGDTGNQIKNKVKAGWGFMANGLEQLLNTFSQKVRTTAAFDDKPYTLNLIGLTGTVKSSASSTIAVAAYSTEYIIDPTKNARIIDDEGKKIEISALKTGDKLTVVGQLADTNKVIASVIRKIAQ